MGAPLPPPPHVSRHFGSRGQELLHLPAAGGSFLCQRGLQGAAPVALCRLGGGWLDVAVVGVKLWCVEMMGG